MDRNQLTDLSKWVRLVEAEYREMPGLNLTKPQMRRLFGLDMCTCDALAEELTSTGRLRLTDSGTYVRKVADPARARRRLHAPRFSGTRTVHGRPRAGWAGPS